MKVQRKYTGGGYIYAPFSVLISIDGAFVHVCCMQ